MKAEFTNLSETRKSLVVEIPTMTVDSEIERPVAAVSAVG